jgi:hypothetical protein
VSGQVVPEGSARLFQGNDQAVGIDADHLQICKFESAKSANVKRVLQTFEAVLMLMQAQPEARDMIQEIPSLNQDSDDALEDNARLQERLATLRN